MNFKFRFDAPKNLLLSPEYQFYFPPNFSPTTGHPPSSTNYTKVGGRSTASRQRDFIEQMLPHALATQDLTGVPASVSLAQAALESGWGKHAPGNNFFGIKGTGPAGSQYLYTTEFSGGKKLRIKAKFRRYQDPLQSFIDHAQLLSKGRTLSHVMAFKGNSRAFVHALQSGKYKYATDPQYEEKIMKIIRAHGLQRYDRSEP